MNDFHKSYGRVPVGLILQKPKASVLYVYVALSSFQGKKRHAFPKLDKICTRAGLKPSAVKAAIAWLVARGWVTRHRRYGKSNLYSCAIIADEPSPAADEQPRFNGNHEPASVAYSQPAPVAHYEPSPMANISKMNHLKDQVKRKEEELRIEAGLRRMGCL